MYCETLQVTKINSLWNAKIVNLLNLLAYENFQDYSTCDPEANKFHHEIDDFGLS